MILDEIIEYKKKELADAKTRIQFVQLVKELEQKGIQRRDFGRAIKREKGGAIRLIAEVKKASPSQGVIREKFNAVKIAEIYAQEVAEAISVLTDKKFFQGGKDMPTTEDAFHSDYVVEIKLNGKYHSFRYDPNLLKSDPGNKRLIDGKSIINAFFDLAKCRRLI